MFGHMSMKINMENLQAIQSKMICSASCRQPDGKFFFEGLIVLEGGELTRKPN